MIASFYTAIPVNSVYSTKESIKGRIEVEELGVKGEHATSQ
jgi:hypothetical protein